MFTKKAVTWLILLSAALSALVISTQVDGPLQTNEDRVRALSEDFACPTCDGQSVAESDAVVAQEIRRDIRRRVDNLESDDEITFALIAAYDESIDLRPRAGGVVGLVWIVPVVVMVFGFAALASIFRRWQRTATQTASEADVAMVETLRQERTGRIANEPQ